MLYNIPRRFWQVINPDELRMIALASDTGEVISDAESADLCKCTFSSAFTEDSDQPCFPVPEITASCTPPLNFFIDGIASLIQNSKPTSSSGIDDINKKLHISATHVFLFSYSPFLQAIYHTTGRYGRSLLSLNEATETQLPIIVPSLSRASPANSGSGYFIERHFIERRFVEAVSSNIYSVA